MTDKITKKKKTITIPEDLMRFLVSTNFLNERGRILLSIITLINFLKDVSPSAIKKLTGMPRQNVHRNLELLKKLFGNNLMLLLQTYDREKYLYHDITHKYYKNVIKIDDAKISKNSGVRKNVIKIDDAKEGVWTQDFEEIPECNQNCLQNSISESKDVINFDYAKPSISPLPPLPKNLKKEKRKEKRSKKEKKKERNCIIDSSIILNILNPCIKDNNTVFHKPSPPSPNINNIGQNFLKIDESVIKIDDKMEEKKDQEDQGVPPYQPLISTQQNIPTPSPTSHQPSKEKTTPPSLKDYATQIIQETISREEALNQLQQIYPHLPKQILNQLLDQYIKLLTPKTPNNK